MIFANNLRKNYGTLEVINDTTLKLPKKGMVAFLCESGSGKTTLVNVLGGLDSYKSGSISYDDTRFLKYQMDKVDTYRRNHFGYIFQNYNILEDKTVSENLLLALHIIGIYDEKECEKRIKNALEAVGLYKFRKKLAGALSGGQMQRVSIARALVKHNDVIIADEPTGNLDSDSTRRIIRILKKLSINSLIILVTHDMSLANTYADYIYHIKDGKISDYKENNLKDNEKEDNFTYDDSLQIEGNKPKSLNDIVVSSQFLINKGLKVGQTINNGDKICGSFDNRKEIVYGLSDRIFIQSIESEEVDCTINDLTRLKGYQTFEVTNKYENIYENNLG